MPTGEYEVAKSKPRGKIRNSDNSFISCMFAIFLFILLCVILILIMLAVKWKRVEGEPEMDEAYSDKSRRTLMNSTTTPPTTRATRITTDGKSMRIVSENSTTSIRPTTSPTTTSATITTTDGELVRSVSENSTTSIRPTTSPTTTSATITTTDGELVRLVSENSTVSIWPTTSPSSAEPTSGASIPKTERAPLSPEDRATTSSEISSSATEAESSSLVPESTVRSATKAGVEDRKETTREVPTMPSTYHEDSTSSTPFETTKEVHLSVEERRGSTDVMSSTDKTVPTTPFETDVPTASQIATKEVDSTSDSSVEERRGSTEVTSLTDKTMPTTPKDFSASNTDMTPTISDIMNETTTGTEKGTEVPESLSTDVPSSSEGDTTVSTGPEVYPTTNTDETTSDIPTTTGSAMSTPSVFTETTVTSPTELPTSGTTILPKTANETCDKLECKRLAGRMLAQMGHEFNPCDNFYMYACGGIHSDPFLQPYDYTVDVMNRIRYGMEKESHSQAAFLKFANFYTSCKEANYLETQLAKELIKILRDIGDFHDPASGKSVNFTHFFAEIISLHRPLLFDIIVDVDESNSDHYMLKMTTPVHENPFRFGSQISPECDQGTDIKNNSYLNEVYETIRTCEDDLKITSLVNGIDGIFVILNNSDDDYTVHRHHYEAVPSAEEWMGIFYKMEPSESERRHSGITKKYRLMTVSELNKKYPVINWTFLLEKLLGKSLPDNTTVQLYSDEYFNKLFGYFEGDNLVKIYNGLLAAFVQQLYADLVLNMMPNEDYCLTVAAKLMEDVAAGAYLNSFNRTELESKRRSVERIFRQLRDAFKQLLHSSDWLESDKDALLKKLDSMMLAADGGVNVFTMEKLNHQMSSVNISEESDSYVRNSIALLRRYRSNIYKSLDGNPRDPENVWSHFSLPQEAYGISVYGINTIAMPYAMLASPFFHSDYPEYLQIAGLGHIIAHEMSHHFDNVGMKYNSKGKREMMLHGTAEAQYRNMETCFEEQFNATESIQSEDRKTFTFSLSAELHREEQLADDIATLVLYSLFKNRSYDLYAERLPFMQMNNDQVFFLHLAQAFCTKDTLQSRVVTLFEHEHLPSLLRVNHFVSQSKDFSDVFNCTADSKMNPTHRCEVFPALNRVL